MGTVFIRRAGIQFKAYIKVKGVIGLDITINGPKGFKTQKIGEDGTTTFTVKKKGSYQITSSYESSSSGSIIEVIERKKTYEITLEKFIPELILSTDNIVVNGDGSKNPSEITVTVKGNNEVDKIGDLLITSSNTNIVTGRVTLLSKDESQIIYSLDTTYVSPGKASITVFINENDYYSYNSINIPISCERTKVTIPSLTGTSFATTGNSVGPGVNDLNTDLITQTGTLSTSNIGTFTVYWDLKDNNRYCWSDGTTTQKSQVWNTYGSSITFRVYCSGKFDRTFRATYGQRLCDVGAGVKCEGWSNSNKYTYDGFVQNENKIARVCYSYTKSGSETDYYLTDLYNLYGDATRVITNGGLYESYYLKTIS